MNPLRPTPHKLGVALAALLLLTGCSHNPFAAKTGPEAVLEVQTAPAAELAELRAEVTATITQLNRTIGNLSRLSNAGNATEVYAAFSRDQKTFADTAETLLVRSARVRNNGNAYFADWARHSAGITDADMRAVTDQRRRTLEQRFNAMLQPLITARADLTTFTTDTANLQKAIAYDQTQDGLAALSVLVKRTVIRGDTAIASLGALGEKLDEIIPLLPPADTNR